MVNIPASANLELGPEGKAFLRHWEAIRVGAELMPDVDRWIEKLTGTLALHTYRAELTRDDCLLLFGGSWLLARGVLGKTGESLYVRYSGNKEPPLSNLRAVVEHPCGYCVSPESKSQLEHSQNVILPLRVPAGRRPQLVAYVDILENAPTPGIPVQGVNKQWWIDVGAGTPQTAPRK